MEDQTPAEAIAAWLRKQGAPQRYIRWLALIPGAACIFVLSQVILMMALSLIVRSGDTVFAPWAMNVFNAAFVPFLIIKYGTPIAPTSRRFASMVLAMVAIVLVAFSRAAFELANPQQTDWRYVWLALAAILGGASVWFGIRSVKRNEALIRPALPD